MRPDDVRRLFDAFLKILAELIAQDRPVEAATQTNAPGFDDQERVAFGPPSASWCENASL
eukprot:NODE_8536_length_378_cov_175.414861.p2 GENE.NODE_8536_length_378_cov_175.414861~~NODE_8536_length_378_cov_175.414861.p2  ORF type:complete len:60 (+),score=7.53 NODE_8536_length_378_cov_175.414861:85-264(+)